LDQVVTLLPVAGIAVLMGGFHFILWILDRRGRCCVTSCLLLALSFALLLSAAAYSIGSCCSC
jgi:hypothetical protein